MTEDKDKKIQGHKQSYRDRLRNKINWRHFSEKPEDDSEVWVLLWHQKGHFPASFQICAGLVETGKDDTWRVNTMDYDGGGAHCYYPDSYDQGFLYWCDKWEISIPEELISWGWNPGV